MNLQDLINLQEAYLNIAENVSTGAGKRASRGGIAQRPSAREIEELKAAAKRKPEPIPEEKPRQKRKGIGILPSGGVGARDKVLRGGYARTPHGIAQRRATELEKKGRTEWRNLSDEQLRSMSERESRIRAALKKSKKWGTPEAAAEEVILGYLIDEGYADCLGSAEIILENMSDEWLDDILEGYMETRPIRLRNAKLALMSKTQRARFLNDEEFDKKYTSTRSEPGSDHSIKGVQTAARAHRRNPNLSGKDLHKIASAAESYDFLLTYLIDEGYADCLGSAEIILENMSDEWMTEIIMDFID